MGDGLGTGGPGGPGGPGGLTAIIIGGTGGLRTGPGLGAGVGGGGPGNGFVVEDTADPGPTYEGVVAYPAMAIKTRNVTTPTTNLRVIDSP